MAGCHRSVDLLVYSLACLFACLLACLLAWYFFWGGGFVIIWKIWFEFWRDECQSQRATVVRHSTLPGNELLLSSFAYTHISMSSSPPPFGANSTIQFNNPIQKHPSTERPSMNQQNWSDSIDERFIIVNKRNDPSGRIEVTPNGHC